MKYIKILTFCFLLACLGFYVVSAKDIDRIGQKLFQKEPEENKQLENDELNIDVNSRFAILVEQDSGRVLYTKQAKKRIHPASLTKIMTVYLALQSITDENKMVQVPADIFPKLEVENASIAGFQPNENVRIKDLLYGALLPSGADACITLAQTIDGSEDAFVKRMNDIAKQLGMHDTHFTNCTGLDDDQHYSSVYDLQLLLREALKMMPLRKYFIQNLMLWKVIMLIQQDSQCMVPCGRPWKFIIYIQISCWVERLVIHQMQDCVLLRRKCQWNTVFINYRRCRWRCGNRTLSYIGCDKGV